MPSLLYTLYQTPHIMYSQSIIVFTSLLATASNGGVLLPPVSETVPVLKLQRLIIISRYGRLRNHNSIAAFAAPVAYRRENTVPMLLLKAII
jgi:hypothetical protein